MNYSGPEWYVKQLRSWERQGVFRRTAERRAQAQAPKPQAPKPQAQSFASTFDHGRSADAKRGAASPLGGKIW
jgi:hypothetical protein